MSSPEIAVIIYLGANKCEGLQKLLDSCVERFKVPYTAIKKRANMGRTEADTNPGCNKTRAYRIDKRESICKVH